MAKEDLKKKYLIEQKNIDETEITWTIVGGPNPVVKGGLWATYHVHVGEDFMVWYRVKSKGLFNKTYNIDEEVIIKYTDFESAEFGKGNGNTWLQCNLTKGFIAFTNTPAAWKVDASQKMVAKINEVTPIGDIEIFNKLIK